MGQVSQQDEKAAAMSEAMAWVAASLSWEQRLNELVSDSPGAAHVDQVPDLPLPAVTGRRRRPATRLAPVPKA
jgi:hypothetical protein